MLKKSDVTVHTIQAYRGTTAVEKEDFLAIEEPLEIRLEYGAAGARITRALSITMRTPGSDEDLVRGFLLTEGIVSKVNEITAIRLLSENVVLAQLDPSAVFDMARLDRHFYTSSSCGVCGKTSIDAVRSNAVCSRIELTDNVLQHNLIYGLPEKLRSAQENFGLTGGLHASALFNRKGELLALREDVGRHNALDKLIGHCAAMRPGSFQDNILLLSGRASFELLQKAAIAGIPVVCAVGAPSSLAVATAAEFGIVLIGFLRDQRFNIYNSPEGITFV